MASWSRAEVEATVADYLSMLRSELSGIRFSKTEHRNRLSRMLNARSDGAIERKHQNVSAILIELGIPYINGYKPLGNYQQLLKEVVSDQVEGDSALLSLVERDVTAGASVPTVADILSALEEPPEARVKRAQYSPLQDNSGRGQGRHIDYLAREAANASLGAAGEEFAVRFEQARLIHAGREHLSDRVERVSATVGDWLGYDIKSCEVDGSDRLIEVKTTGYGKEIPFYVTRNEVFTSTKLGKHYHLYRLFQFRENPRLFHLKGALTDTCQLEPTVYEASAR